MQTFIQDSHFNSDLIRSADPGATNHIMQITLRIRLEQIRTPPNTCRDGDNNVFNIRNWHDHEWLAFTEMVRRQSNVWNDKFWLIPPEIFTEWDLELFLGGPVVVRPNFKCILRVSVVTGGQAHKTIRAARLAQSYVGDNATMRSDAMTYDSLDGIAHTFAIPDNTGSLLNIVHYTIPHEIGHALGQPHIGVMRRTQACMQAIQGPTAGDDTTIGGSNSHRCYGWGDPPSICENIMGYGTQFEVLNADPWRWRIARHTETRAQDWQVATARPAPRCLPVRPH